MNEVTQPQQSSSDTVLKEKIYKDRVFWTGTFLGGPLAAGYFFYKNFKALGESDKITPTWIITIISMFILVFISLSIPDDTNFPSFIIPLIQASIASVLFSNYQKDKVSLHIENGGEFYGWWNVILVTLLAAITSMTLIFTYVAYFEI